MQALVSKIFQRKSDSIMLLAGLCILASVLMVALTGDFVFWKFAKFFYFTGIILILLDR